MEIGSWAGIVTAILTPITVVVVAWINQRKIENVRRTAEATLGKATSTDHAVNGRGGRRSTIEQDVETIRAKQEADAPSVIQDRGLVQIVEELLVELKKTNGGRA